MSPQLWLGLQMDYDLDLAMDALANRLNQNVNRGKSHEESIN